MNASDLAGILQQRGIADVAARAQWEPYRLETKDGAWWGWQYPVFDAQGRAYDQVRYKGAEDGAPKYFWPKGKHPRAKYYFLPGLLSAIEQRHGVLYIAAGEPDVLAYHAADNPNTLCWLAAEISVPDSLASDLAYMGVREVRYAPDRDNAGMRSAAKVYEALRDTDIGFTCFELPGEMGSGYDVNRLWVDQGFNAADFALALWNTFVDETDLQLYARSTGDPDASAQKIADTVERWRDDWYKEVIDAMGSPHMKQGTAEFWRCPLPHRHQHGDKHPSFRFSTQQNPDHPWPVCSCDIQNETAPWDMVADALNLDGWQEYKRRRAAESGVDVTHRQHQQPLGFGDQTRPDETPLFVVSTAVYQDLQDELRGVREPDGDPLMFPYRMLHPFGGFARFMWTGKLVGIGGISGGGKTMLLRCLFAALLSKGWDVIWWGPEWSPHEYGLQDLQRLGGLNFEQVNELRVLKALRKRHPGKTDAELLADTGLSVPGARAVEDSINLLDTLIDQEGRTYFIPDMRMPVNRVMETVEAIATTARREGRKVAAFGFDYVQLANLPGKRDWTWGKRVVAEVKAGCSPSAANVVGFLTVQSRKDDAERVRESGDILSVSAAQGLDEHPFNLYLTLTPLFSDGQKLPAAIVKVEKNNMGQAHRHTTLYADWARLAIYDQPAKVTTVNLNEDEEAT